MDITHDQIAHTVTVFYGAVRRHEVPASIFVDHVGDWPALEARITAFRAGAILRAPGYGAGSPMRAHLLAGNVRPEHFAIWLALFDKALRRTLPTWLARDWSASAHRIGQGLRAGVQNSDAGRTGPPDLR